MGPGSKEKDGEPPVREDVEQFMELRRHVKKLQVGTPLLLRTINAHGQEELQICTFSVTQDLQMLRWKDQEGTGTVHEVPLNAVVDITEDGGTSPSARTREEDAHHALTLSIRRGPGEVRKPSTMGLICATPEDLVSWREGLKFLVAALPPPPSPAAASSTSRAAKPSTGSPTAAARRPAPSEAEEELRRQLQQEREASAELRKENERLSEALKRKDATIAELRHDLQTRPVAAAEPCSKTESTSRESDDHLRDREATVLRRRNRRLQKALHAKQQTVAELLQLLGRVTQQQGAESSAVEDVGEDDDICSETGDAVSALRGAAAVAGAKSVRQPAMSTAVVDMPADPGAGHPRPGAVLRGDASDGSSEPEAVREEMRALAGKLDRLERDVECLQFEPPPRRAGDSGGGGGGSAAALQALERELELLEEKKRVVERLAHQLEPPTDNEAGGEGDEEGEEEDEEGEDDGFPLR